MALNLNEDRWAYDLSKDISTKGEIFDEDCISQSIEIILATYFGERVFNPLFGSTLPIVLFEGFSNKEGERLVDEIIQSLETWEDRISIDKDNVRFNFIASQNTLEIYIPYVIIKQKIVSFFSKRIAV